MISLEEKVHHMAKNLMLMAEEQGRLLLYETATKMARPIVPYYDFFMKFNTQVVFKNNKIKSIRFWID